MGFRNSTNLRDGLVGAWCPSVSGAQGYLLPDLSGNGWHGLCVNMDAAAWSTVNGFPNLAFDGVNDAVETDLVINSPEFSILLLQF
jgi:hypothetical protein